MWERDVRAEALKTLIRCGKMHEKNYDFQLAEHARYF